jgi:acetyltransferase-like isoleucine patch superfamily enzyme
MHISDIVRQHPAWSGGAALFGTPGYSIISFEELDCIPVDPEHQDRLAVLGLRFDDDLGQANKIYIHPRQEPLDLSIRLRGCQDTCLVFGQGESFSGRLAFNGRGSLFLAAGFDMMGSRSVVQVTMGHGAAVYFGKGCTSVQSDWLVEGHGRSLIVGDDLMASWHVTVRNYDSHAIIDMQDGRVINAPANSLIGPHCWLGLGASILRGVKIGRSVIVGTHATVLSDISECCAVAGAPARVVREKVTWTRTPSPSQTMIANTIARWGWSEQSC